MKLNRQAIQRMINAGELNTGGRRGGGSGAGGGGGVSAAWVEQNYISKAFFARIFKVWVGYGNSKVEIEPNDEMPTPDTSVNIQAVYGLWTEKFLTALGQGTGGGGGGGGGASTLAELNDVTLTNPQNGNLLQYYNSHWVNVTLSDLLTAYATRQWCLDNFVQNQNFVHPSSIWGQNWPTTETPIAGDMTGVDNITMNNNKAIKMKDTDNSAVSVVQFTSGNIFIVGNQAHDTHIKGTNVKMVYGVSSVTGFILNSSGNIGIGSDSPQHKLHVIGGIYSTSYVTALSDIRMKNIIDRFTIDVDKIASASLIHFTWKEGYDYNIQAGCIAQEWQEILPEVVIESEDGTLSLDYGKIGATAAVSLARKVQDQEYEIAELKAKNADLEERLAKIEKLLESKL